MAGSSGRSWRGRVFIATSLDGYIARPDGDLDWLTDRPSEIKHESVASDRHALDWSSFLPSTDHIVMGRGTYQKVRSFDRWPYADHDVVVVSTTLDPALETGVTVTRSAAEAAELLSRRGAREVYVDGGKVIQAFLAADLIDEITVSVSPVVIGAGIPLFGSAPGDVWLRLRAAHASEGGMTHATYDVVRLGG
jgi:dihydrofolate reductase